MKEYYQAIFISDIHLMGEESDNYIKTNKNLENFFNHILNTGGTLFINGDLFDFYFEYKDVIPKKYFSLPPLSSLRKKIPEDVNADLENLFGDAFSKTRKMAKHMAQRTAAQKGRALQSHLDSSIGSGS